MITIKPHHFVDIITRLGDQGAAFAPHPYGHAVHTVAQQILADRDVLLCIEFGCDDICKPCCHNANGVCDDVIDVSFRPLAPSSKQDYNLLLDQRWSERLGLEPGDRLTAREFCVRIQERAGDIERIYQETPVQRTRMRQTKLRKGLTRFLSEESAAWPER